MREASLQGARPAHVYFASRMMLRQPKASLYRHRCTCEVNAHWREELTGVNALQVLSGA